MQQKFEEHAHTFHLKVCKLAVSFVGTLSSLHVETLWGVLLVCRISVLYFSLGPDLSDFLGSTSVAGVGGTSRGLSRRGCSSKLL